MTKVQTSLLSSAILAAALFGAFAITQAAYANEGDGHHRHHSGIEISVSSHAMVTNHVETKADTGDNYAGGSVGGDGGNGGDIENEYGSQDVEGATTGAGGTGGNSGLGGFVQTGNASASASLMNDVNSSDIAVDSCGCEGTTTDKIRVRINTHDFAFLSNSLRTKADSGDNRARGSYAGDGGNGGDIENGEGDGAEQEVDDSTTGAGGVGGNSSTGGTVQTGSADSRTDIVNLINSRLIRVTH